MTDQANRLRELMNARAGADRSPSSGNIPRLLVVAGGKGGVGTTTLAVNLSLALAIDGRRTLLVDADANHADVAAQCGLVDGHSLGDVMAGRRTLHEAIHRGPGGMQVLAGRWGDRAEDWTTSAAERLLGDLRRLGQHCDQVLIDVGATAGPLARATWRAADMVVVVTTPDNVSIMDAYASVKTILDTSEHMRVATLVNQADDEQRAAEVHDRLRRACQRFLGIEVSALGSIPFDAQVREAASAMLPVLLHAPQSVAAERITRLSSGLLLAEQTGDSGALQVATK